MDRIDAPVFFTKRAGDDAQRIIRGIATTGSVDRVRDVVVPEGVTVRGSVPLLWQHDHLRPIGTAFLDKPTAAGVGFTAKILKVDTPGPLRDRLDEAWELVASGTLKSVSIGFRVLENGSEHMKGGGIRFTKTEVIELSIVSVGANPDALITSLKATDPLPSDRLRADAAVAAFSPAAALRRHLGMDERKPARVVRINDPPRTARVVRL